jgi:Ulp1 family protease
LTTFLFLDIELSAFDIAVVPIGNGCHWKVAIVFMKQRQIVITDSLEVGDFEAQQLDNDLLVEYLKGKGCGEFNVANVKVSSDFKCVLIAM